MARRPPTGPGYTIGGTNHQQQQRGRRSSSSTQSSRIGIMRLLAIVGFGIVLWGMYLYVRVLRAVSLTGSNDGSGNHRYSYYPPPASSGRKSGVLQQQQHDRSRMNTRERWEEERRDDHNNNMVLQAREGMELDPYKETLIHSNKNPNHATNTIIGGDYSHSPETADENIILVDDSKRSGGSSSRAANYYKTPWHGAPPPTPPYWIESDPDDSFERIYLSNEERKKYKHLRNLGPNGDVNGVKGIKHYFNPMCRHYRFDESILPTVSVIMTTQNEPDNWVSISVESILARTPPSLLKDIIVVDDNGMPGHHGLPENIRKNVDEAEWDYIQSLSPKVKVIHHDDREGCARSRLTGAKAASGEVLMFVDSHIEMESSTWYHHLVAPIMENPHTIAMQLIDIIDDLGTKGYGDGVGMGQYGIVNTEFWFGYQGDRFGDYMEPIDASNFTESEIEERKKMKYLVEKPSVREPYETPFGPGSLFAIRADEFWRLGGYDEGLYVWGGENTEMAFKMWMCGGRMLMVPCSRVGHMYRQHKESDGRGALSRWPPTLPQEMTDRLGCAYKNGTYTGKFIVLRHPADNFTRITTRNNLRVMETWVGDHPAKYAYYKRLFGQTTLKPEFQLFIDQWRVDPVAQKQVHIKEENQCHDFEWFDKHVFMRLTGRHHPWHPDNKKYIQVSCGNHKAKSCDLCPQGHGKDWCHGDCTWCGTSEKCFPADDWSKLCKGMKGGLRSSSNNKEALAKKNEAAHIIEAHDEQENAKIEAADEIPILHIEKRERALLSKDMIQTDKHLTLSVVLPCGFEHDFFIRTAESIFYETPEEILKEIVVVDDASDPPLQNSWPEEEAAKFGVKYVRVDTALGLIGAKQVGAEAATGDIIVFFDCHVKPAKDYWIPYVKAVEDNYRRVVIPTITSLNVDTWEEFGRPASGGGGMSKCYLTFDAEFKWTTDNTPFVPIMSGGLLAISRKWFFEIGGYDSTMKGWGGENLDQSLRIWTCGGEIVSAPESYVAHMWRVGTDPKTKAKYKVGAGDAIKNRARAVKAHLGRWYEKTLTFPSFQEWRGRELDTSSINNALSNLECEDFEWYLNRFKHIYHDAGVLPREVFQIEAIVQRGDEASPLCLELNSMGWTNFGSADDIVLRECVGPSASEPRSIWWHGSSRLNDGKCCGSLRAWNTDQCIDGRNPEIGSSKLETYTCDLDSGLEAFLQPSEDNNDQLTLRLGRNNKHVCVRVNDDALFEFVQCEQATKFRKRNAFTPIEFELLSSNSKSAWQEE